MKRPPVLSGITYKLSSDCGPVYLTCNKEPGNGLTEIFLRLGKSGHCVRTLLDTIAVLISVLLQLGVSKEKLEKTLTKHFVDINCGQKNSCIDLIGRAIIEEIKEEKK
jgi:ribonucleoside-diphosphate reductase alpha chain